MSQIKLHLQSFNAGELAPTMAERFGVEKVATGCRKLRNLIPHVHGPVSKRPGLKWLGTNAGVDHASRLIPFVFSVTTRFVLELHPSGLRVWTADGDLVTLTNPVALPYTAEEMPEVQYAQVNDVVFLAHPNHEPRKLTRVADDNWTLTAFQWKWPPLLNENTRDDSALVKIVTPLMDNPAELWPEATVPVGAKFDVSWSGGSGTNTVTLQRWTGSAWTNVQSYSSTASVLIRTFTVATAGVHRVTATLRSGTTGSATVWTPGTFPDPSTFYINLDLSQSQPYSRREVTLAVGEWQVTVDGRGAGSPPAGASAEVQRWNGSAWVNVSALTLTADKVTVYTGATLVSTQRTRIVWTGNAWQGAVMRIEQVTFPPSSDVTIALNATTGSGVTMTASSALFDPGHVGGYWQIAHRRDTAFREASPGNTFSASQTTGVSIIGRWDVFTYGTWHATLHLEKQLPDGSWMTIRSWSSKGDRNVIASGEEESQAMMRLRWSASSATGANPRFVLEAADSKVYGLVKVTAHTSATVMTVDVVRDVHSTDATVFWTEGAFSTYRGFPRALAFHGGRLWFAGTRREPGWLFGSVANDFESFRRSSLDDGGLAFQPASEQGNGIIWLQSQGRQLLLGTSGDEWTLESEGPAITPSDARFERQSGFGAAPYQAVIVNQAVAWVQRGGRKLRRVTPRTANDTWNVGDLTALAEHVTTSGIKQLAVQNNPDTILWAVTNEGALIGMTYEVEQNVFAWHVHETAGRVESVCVLPDADEDQVWVATLRTGQRFPVFEDGQTFYGEWSLTDAQNEQYHEDAIVTYEGEYYIGLTTPTNADAPSSSTDWQLYEPGTSDVVARSIERFSRDTYLDGFVTVLDATSPYTVPPHLDGAALVLIKENGTLADVSSVANGTVSWTGGQQDITLGHAFTATLQPSRIEIPMRDGTAQARAFKVARVGVRVLDSRSGQVADGPDGVFETLEYPATPYSGMLEQAIEARTVEDVNVILKDSKPYALTVAALVLKMDVYGD